MNRYLFAGLAWLLVGIVFTVILWLSGNMSKKTRYLKSLGRRPTLAYYLATSVPTVFGWPIYLLIFIVSASFALVFFAYVCYDEKGRNFFRNILTKKDKSGKGTRS